MKKLELQLRALTVLLTTQFILGVILTTLIDYNPNRPTAVQTAFLVLHIVVAVALLAVAAAFWLATLKNSKLKVYSAAGLLSVIGAMAAGTVAAANGNDVAVFLMALGFLFAFGAYGYSMSAVRGSGL